MTALDEIAAERRRQMAKEGWTHEHDDGHCDRSLAAAAATYAWLASLHEDARKAQIKHQGYGEDGMFVVVNELWPQSWVDHWFKPKSRRRDLIRAGALIVAEIERMDREKTAELEEV